MNVELAVSGTAAPPRTNGELAFTEPWQPRAFAVAVELAESGAVPWSAFQTALIDAIDRDAALRTAGTDLDVVDPDAGYDYWACWLVALQVVLDEHGLCPAVRVDERAREIHARSQH